MRKAYKDPNADEQDRYGVLSAMAEGNELLFANDFINALWDPSPSVRHYAVIIVRVRYEAAKNKPDEPDAEEIRQAYGPAVPRLWELTRTDTQDVSAEAGRALRVMDEEAFASYLESAIRNPEERPWLLHGSVVDAGAFLLERGNQLGFYLGDTLAVGEARTRWLKRNRERSDKLAVDLAALSWAAVQKHPACRDGFCRMVRAICHSPGMKQAIALEEIVEVKRLLEANLRVFADVEAEKHRSESLREFGKALGHARETSGVSGSKTG